MAYQPKTLLGHIACPECDFLEAEVKTDKSGHPYRFCPDCNAQTFTRGDAKRAKNMLGKMRPVQAAPAAPAAVVPDPLPEPRKAPVAAETKPEAPSKPKPRRVFATLLDSAGAGDD